jgi:hypothetical protein
MLCSISIRLIEFPTKIGLVSNFKRKKMKKYLAFECFNCSYEAFETIQEAREWLEECFFSPDEGYHPDLKGCRIYKLVETVDYNVIDKKSNYKYDDENDIPEGDDESEAWPHRSDFDEIWKHKFVRVK